MANKENKVNQKQENLLAARNNQLMKFRELINRLGQGYWWYQGIRNGYTIGEAHVPGTHEHTVQLSVIVDLLEQGWELVAALQDNWFDEGGQQVNLILANQEARERVWKKIDCLAPKINRIATLEYVQDMQLYPEEYILIGSGPV